MPELPVLSGKQVLRALIKHGYRAVRRKGSHVFVESADGASGTAIPLHGNEDLGKGLLKSILNDLGLSVDDLRCMLDR
ncbi:type II toxin-antitoxin system HicA family toxin [Candidatus Peregrinibacteria bacterium]|nr:type II toxin-antitoxin system HicA family toxin [Candidatus Peregrinibacteria bacterium]